MPACPLRPLWRRMKKFKGLPASPGLVYGPARVIQPSSLHVEKRSVVDCDSELARLEPALQQAEASLRALAQRARRSAAGKEAGIFDAQIAILRDPELLKRARNLVKDNRVNLEYAWQQAIQSFAGALRRLDNPYLAARAADVEDVGQRLLSLLARRSETIPALEAPCVLVAEDLTPADTVSLDRERVLAFCTRLGAPTSHVAILSKALGIPCVVALGDALRGIPDGAPLIVDGRLGEVILEPDPTALREYELLAAREGRQARQALVAAGLPAITQDDHRVEVAANVGSLQDALDALPQGAEGIGLLRTEFLFLDRAQAPDQEQQCAEYTKIFSAIGPSYPIVVRTLDIGGDKPVSYLPLPPEQNPFLGLRGLRLSLRHPRLLHDQLSALLISGAGYDLRIMFPMVSSLEEFLRARAILDACRRDLIAEGRPHAGNVQVGIMVEVPSAAILARAFARVVDFFSIGTNDLAQYTLAAERTGPEVAALADPFHPAILELIRRVVAAAHRRGKWVGLCGEFAGDPLAAPLLLGLGLDELSASPRLIPRLKQTIRALDRAACQKLARRALQLTGADDVRAHLARAQPVE